ncbi:MAG TPA: Ku protein [Thermoanaerobaculia bacterium]|jgi:DNA end-binding protein Ku|nr:Ku protein [Thermoanaerobaculia bacterium]
MARSIWKGSITFGLVNIPVGLYSAEKREEVSFHLLDRKNKARVKYKRVNEETGREVAWEDTVRGFELESGKYVILTDEDLQRAAPEKTQTVDILDFVDLEEIDPSFFDKPYYLAPDKKGAKSYALLREVLKRTKKVGISKVVIRSKQYLAAVIAEGDVIVLNILRFAHELRDPKELDLPHGKEGVTERELDMAERLVEGMVDSWDPDKYRDDYYKDLMKMIHERAEAGQYDEAPEAPAAPKPERAGNVVDLMALLKQSVEGGGRKPAKKAPAKKTAKKTAARKAPAKRTASKRKTA